jgi:hypothetical protein
VPFTQGQQNIPPPSAPSTAHSATVEKDQ